MSKEVSSKAECFAIFLLKDHLHFRCSAVNETHPFHLNVLLHTTLTSYVSMDPLIYNCLPAGVIG